MTKSKAAMKYHSEENTDENSRIDTDFPQNVNFEQKVTNRTKIRTKASKKCFCKGNADDSSKIEGDLPQNLDSEQKQPRSKATMKCFYDDYLCVSIKK